MCPSELPNSVILLVLAATLVVISEILLSIYNIELLIVVTASLNCVLIPLTFDSNRFTWRWRPPSWFLILDISAIASNTSDVRLFSINSLIILYLPEISSIKSFKVLILDVFWLILLLAVLMLVVVWLNLSFNALISDIFWLILLLVVLICVLIFAILFYVWVIFVPCVVTVVVNVVTILDNYSIYVKS